MENNSFVKIRNKTTSEWMEHFRIPVSTDISPVDCRLIDAMIIGHYQEATLYKLEAEARYSALEVSRKSEYNKKFISLYNSTKKDGARGPAKDVLVVFTENELTTYDEAINVFYTETNFWKGILHMLDTTRKLIETISISHGIEAKALNYQNYKGE